jgi:hypothetical protein
MEDFDDAESSAAAGSEPSHFDVPRSKSSPDMPPRESIVRLNADLSNTSSVNVKSIISNQQQWRVTYEGYQNFFEFGEFGSQRHCNAVMYQITSYTLTSFCSGLHGVVSRGSVAGNERRGQLRGQQCTGSCLQIPVHVFVFSFGIFATLIGSVCQMLRNSLKIGTSDILAIDSQEAFWDFFDVLVEKLFQTEWYNGQVVIVKSNSNRVNDYFVADSQY